MHSADLLFFKVQTQIVELNLQLAEAEEKPKRSSDFESTYKNAAGNEVTVKRAPDGKFANKGNSATTQGGNTTNDVGDTFSKQFLKLGQNIAKMPFNVQENVRSAIFDSKISKAINKELSGLARNINNPNFTQGFNLGQDINAELAKTPFSKFGETIIDKFIEFKKQLPQKSDDLKKEIVRIAKDPDTATTIAAEALLGLAANFYLASLFSGLRAGRLAYTLFKLPKASTLATDLASEIPEFAGEAGAKTAATMLAIAKGLGVAIISAEVVMAMAFDTIGHIIQDQANQELMNRVKAKESIENKQLERKLTKMEEKDASLYKDFINHKKAQEVAKQQIVRVLKIENINL